MPLESVGANIVNAHTNVAVHDVNASLLGGDDSTTASGTKKTPKVSIGLHGVGDENANANSARQNEPHVLARFTFKYCKQEFEHDVYVRNDFSEQGEMLDVLSVQIRVIWYMLSPRCLRTKKGV